MTSRAGSRVVGLAVLVAALLLGSAAAASAHNSLERSDPPNLGMVAIGRAELTLWFGEPVDDRASSFSVRRTDPVRGLRAGDRHARDRTTASVHLAVPPLERGTYAHPVGGRRRGRAPHVGHHHLRRRAAPAGVDPRRPPPDAGPARGSWPCASPTWPGCSWRSARWRCPDGCCAPSAARAGRCDHGSCAWAPCCRAVRAGRRPDPGAAGACAARCRPVPVLGWRRCATW